MRVHGGGQASIRLAPTERTDVSKRPRAGCMGMSESYALYFVADGHLLPKVYSVMACTKPRLPALIEFEKAVKALIAVAIAVAATTATARMVARDRDTDNGG